MKDYKLKNKEMTPLLLHQSFSDRQSLIKNSHKSNYKSKIMSNYIIPAILALPILGCVTHYASSEVNRENVKKNVQIVFGQTIENRTEYNKRISKEGIAKIVEEVRSNKFQ